MVEISQWTTFQLEMFKCPILYLVFDTLLLQLIKQQIFEIKEKLLKMLRSYEEFFLVNKINFSPLFAK